MGKKLLVVWIFLINILLAKDYALIIGVWNYNYKTYFDKLDEKKVKDDIALYHSILESWGINKNEDYVKTLKNATKKEIISELEYIGNQNDIDRFYMFFTGHGLSARNKHYENRKLKNDKTLRENMKYSGAIVPYGFDANKLDTTLIIGCLDLKPLLSKIDKKTKKGLIMFDACYSKNSARDNKTNKRVNLSEKSLCSDKDKSYPYKKLVYISSSSIKAELGMVSKGLKRCLSKKDNKSWKKSEIKKCLNEDLNIKAQRAKVFGQNNLSVF